MINRWRIYKSKMNYKYLTAYRVIKLKTISKKKHNKTLKFRMKT